MNERDMITQWPFPVGKSPFHIKGTAYAGIVRFIKKKAPGGLEAVLAAANNPELSTFFEQRFLASAFYDVYPLPLIDVFAAKVMGSSYYDYVYDSAYAQMQSDLGGVYKLLLKVVSPVKVMSRLAAVTQAYFDFAPTTVEKQEDKTALLMRQGFPHLLLPWYQPVGTAYSVAAVEATGAKGVTTDFSYEVDPAKQHGVELVTLKLAISWS